MLNSLKASAAVLLGVLLGFVVAVPMAWYGTRIGADSLRRNVWNTLAAVESRQQQMADQALQVQPLLQRFKAAADPDVFEAIQDERSRLAGEASLGDKLRRVQRLEEVLLRSELLWAKAGQRSPKVRAWEPWSEHGRTWEKQKRLLVREQKDLQDSVDELDTLLARWPVGVLLAHRTFWGLINGLFGDLAGNTAFLARLSLDWLGYSLRRVASLVGQQKPPDPPNWDGRPKGTTDVAYMDPLPPPVFLADAPLPEDDYTELQFTRESPQNYADVELGEDKAVLENRSAPAGYQAVAPSPQKTVTYSAPN